MDSDRREGGEALKGVGENCNQNILCEKSDFNKIEKIKFRTSIIFKDGYKIYIQRIRHDYKVHNE